MECKLTVGVMAATVDRACLLFHVHRLSCNLVPPACKSCFGSCRYFIAGHCPVTSVDGCERWISFNEATERRWWSDGSVLG